MLVPTAIVAQVPTASPGAETLTLDARFEGLDKNLDLIASAPTRREL